MQAQVLDKCPIWQSDNNRVVFAYVCDEKDEDDDGSSFSYQLKNNISKSVAFYNTACIGTIYKVLLREPYDKDKPITKYDILNYEAVRNSRTIESEPRPDESELVYLNKDTNTGLQIYMRRSGVNLRPASISNLYKKSRLRPSTPLTVYRGLSFEKEEWLDFQKEIRVSQLRVGDTFQYLPYTLEGKLKTADSWTTNVCLAVHFAMLQDYGIVVKYVAPPNEVIVDTRRIENRSDFYHHDQAEIILTNYRLSIVEGKLQSSDVIRRIVEVVFIVK